MQEKLLPSISTTIYAQVALPVPMRKYFDYLPPNDGLCPSLQVGVRVEVPFGKQTLIGIIVAITNTTTVDLSQLKAIIRVIDPHPLLPGKLFALLVWASKYYQHPLGLVVDAALPKRLRQGDTIDSQLQTGWRLATTYDPKSTSTLRSKKQQRLLEFLAQHPSGSVTSILNSHGFDQTIRNKLLAKNLIESYQINIIEQADLNNQPITAASQLVLNPDQLAAVAKIAQALATFQVFLLDGVTGSGKTEVYLQMIAQVLQRKQQVLILIPEISLTPQTLKQFQHRFNTEVMVYHSQISDKARAHAWFKAEAGVAKIIIGTRSAAFLPLQNPGLFIVDEEHDLSFKQQEGFRYSARDLLIKRAQLESCPIILGSATPALETLYNASLQRYHHLKLSKRAGGATQPKIEILDVRHKKLKHGLSLQLIAEIEQHLANNGQVLLFLNRRGYAPVLLCSNCNWVQNCTSCTARMIIHFQPQPAIICHHCHTKEKMPRSCPNCGNSKLAPIGFGTEKLEQVLQTLFPQANILRADSDTTSRKDAMQKIIDQVISGKANILLGTQMLAKGHHFPNLSLVAILDIDGALFSSDFRALERMGQLITQVAGRAGRAEVPGHVILQTQHPDHPLLQKLLQDGYHALCDHLLTERLALQLPPFGYQILLRAASKQALTALDFFSWLKQQLTMPQKNVELLGPIPAPIEKKADLFIAHLLIQASSRRVVHSAALQLLAKIADYPRIRQIQWTVDVDPLDFY